MLLNGKEKKYLKGLAHSLEAAVFLGTNGVNASFISSLNENLKSNELVKVKFIKFKDEKKFLAKDIETKSKAQIVGLIGNVLILYKQNSKLKNSIDLKNI